MLLIIDAGNSTTVFGLASTNSMGVLRTWRLRSQHDRTADEWRALLTPLLQERIATPGAITAVVISSVVPALTRSLTMLSRSWFSREPMLVGADLNLGIRVSVDHPFEVGADRLANAVAAYARFGAPVIDVDAGTATKIDVVAQGGAFVGGVIAPGIGVGLQALASRAARLYAVELNPPTHAIGRNTTEAIQSGVVLGHLAMIEGMVRRLRDEIGAVAPVVLTGGYGDKLVGQSSIFTAFEPDLTLTGLALIWSKNQCDSRADAEKTIVAPSG